MHCPHCDTVGRGNLTDAPPVVKAIDDYPALFVGKADGADLAQQHAQFPGSAHL